MKYKGLLAALISLVCLPFISHGQDELSILRKNAEQGNVNAQALLGICYYEGDGIEQDSIEAEKWLRLAAEQGNANAQALLGICYYEGTSVLQDYEEAERWLRLAAEQGEINAQRFLGLCYYAGAGVSRDHTQAYAWFNIAAAQGDEKAASLRANCLKKMTASQISKGQRLSRKYAERFLK